MEKLARQWKNWPVPALRATQFSALGTRFARNTTMSANTPIRKCPGAPKADRRPRPMTDEEREALAKDVRRPLFSASESGASSAAEACQSVAVAAGKHPRSESSSGFGSGSAGKPPSKRARSLSASDTVAPAPAPPALKRIHWRLLILEGEEWNRLDLTFDDIRKKYDDVEFDENGMFLASPGELRVIELSMPYITFCKIFDLDEQNRFFETGALPTEDRDYVPGDPYCLGCWLLDCDKHCGPCGRPLPEDGHYVNGVAVYPGLRVNNEPQYCLPSGRMQYAETFRCCRACVVKCPGCAESQKKTGLPETTFWTADGDLLDSEDKHGRAICPACAAAPSEE